MLDRLPRELRRQVIVQLEDPRDLLALESVSHAVRHDVLTLGREGAYYRSASARLPRSLLQALPAEVDGKAIERTRRVFDPSVPRLNHLHLLVLCADEADWRRAVHTADPLGTARQAYWHRKRSSGFRLAPWSLLRDGCNATASALAALRRFAADRRADGSPPTAKGPKDDGCAGRKPHKSAAHWSFDARAPQQGAWIRALVPLPQASRAKENGEDLRG